MQKRLFVVFLAMILFSVSSFGRNTDKKFFRKANRFFKRYVYQGKVDYTRLNKNQEKLTALVEIIGNYKVADRKTKTQKAFYINAYNLLLIKAIVDNPSVQFPLEHSGLFSSLPFRVSGDTMTLNELEEKRLIGNFKDVRVLFVLSSASLGSPKLSSHAYKPGKLNRQFKRKIKEVSNSYEYVRVFKKSSLILLAESFKRSQKDFDKNEIRSYINKYREDPLPENFVIDYYPANRKLNIQN